MFLGDTSVNQPGGMYKNQLICYACYNTCHLPNEIVLTRLTQPFKCSCAETSNCLFQARLANNSDKVQGKLRDLMLESINSAFNNQMSQFNKSQQQQQQPSKQQINSSGKSSIVSALESGCAQALSYENRNLQAKAKQLVPIDRLRQNAIENADSPEEENEEFARQLLKWFKNEFFRWFDKAKCVRCGSNETKPIQHTSPTSEEMKWGARVVEMYICTLCGGQTRFPRYNSAEKLLETREGIISWSGVDIFGSLGICNFMLWLVVKFFLERSVRMQFFF